MTTIAEEHAPSDLHSRFVETYEACRDQVRRFVRARVDDVHLADDLTSEVFLRAWRSWHRFDPARGPAAGWLLAIASNVIVDARRRQGRQVVVDVHALEAPDPAAGPETTVLRDDVRARVVALVDTLPPRARRGLALRYGEDRTSRQIARVLGTSPAAAKALLYRATVQLRRPARARGLEPAA